MLGGDRRGSSIRRIGIGVLPCSLLLAGCLTSVHSPMEGGPRSGGPTVLLAGLTVSTHIDEVSTEPFEAGVVDGYEVLSVRMPSSGFNRQPDNQIAARYYRALDGERRALVVIVPAWGNAPYPATTLRRHVLRSDLSGDVDILQILGEESMFDWPALRAAEDPVALERVAAQSVRSFQTLVTDLRGLLVWAHRTFDLDPRRVGIVGYSLGATAAAHVLAFEPTMAAGVLILPAASLHEVLASCGNNVRRSRKEILERQGWTLDEMRDWFEDPLRPIDPLRFLGAIPTDRVLLVEAARDQCVPERTREAIWRGLGRPERITIDGGHRTSFLTMTPLGLHETTRKVMRFLERRLGEPETVPGGVVVAGSR